MDCCGKGQASFLGFSAVHVDGQLKVIVADSEEKVPFLVLICKVPGFKKKKISCSALSPRVKCSKYRNEILASFLLALTSCLPHSGM